MTPEQVIEEIRKAGLRGRGGGGFPTAQKWDSARKANGSPKYVIANGNESNPGSFMNRILMEGNPNIILEGLIIGAYAIGARMKASCTYAKIARLRWKTCSLPSFKRRLLGYWAKTFWVQALTLKLKSTEAQAATYPANQAHL
jgi:hypothetical protein